MTTELDDLIVDLGIIETTSSDDWKRARVKAAAEAIGALRAALRNIADNNYRELTPEDYARSILDGQNSTREGQYDGQA